MMLNFALVTRIAFVLFVAMLSAGCAGIRCTRCEMNPRHAEGPPSPKDTLVAFHKAASEADEDTYFSILSSHAVFLGTDATERWTFEEFREFAMPYFERESAWTYTPVEQCITVDRSGRIAWFDETLDNEHYGRVRGSGVMRIEGGRWRIVQYNLTFTVPNELADTLVEMIRGAE